MPINPPPVEDWPACRFVVSYTDDFLQSNALRCEVITPKPLRCRLKQPERLKAFDPTGFRWYASGGDPLHFGECTYPKCPGDRYDHEDMD